MDPVPQNPAPPQPAPTQPTLTQPPNQYLDLLLKLGRAAAKVWVGCTSALGSCIVIFFLFTLFLFASLSHKSSDKVISGTGPDKIAVVNLNGEIFDDGDSSGGGLLSGQSASITPSLIDGYINQIKADPLIKAVIFQLNSPGGAIVASDQINAKITQLKQSGVKVIFLYGGEAASGGYYISAPADKIVANPATLTGSIGVIAEVLNVKGLYDKLGLTEEVYKTGPNKDLLNPTRARTPAEETIVQNMLNQALEQFIDRVAAGRGMDKAAVRKIADGSVYTGVDAKKLGLVDELGNFDKAVEVAKKEAGLTDPEIIDLGSPSFFGSLLNGKLPNPLSFLGISQNNDSGVKVQYLLDLGN